MHRKTGPIAFLTVFIAALRGITADASTAGLHCPLFAQANVPAPAPRPDPKAIERFQLINREASAGSHRVLFLGDSLIQKWDVSLWDRYFAPADALNAGVNGDRTEHLLWRIKHGNLERQQPKLIVLLIGTNDIGRSRPAQIIAEGVRRILAELRLRVPSARILLIGVLPRNRSPDSHRRREVAEVNQLIRICNDEKHVFYANIGKSLLDQAGRLTREVSTDGVHLTEHGYARLTGQLEVKFKDLLPGTPARSARFLKHAP
ncbi:MAG TPA: GDSL-type esterase/lipase family protein [Stellaceae bacterium]|nr:GDSL-type esterase/lipase family protein [Stellaceae bacterium]